MNPSSLSRLALAFSVVGLALALTPLLARDDEARRAVAEAEPDAHAPADPSAAGYPALAAEIEGLRNELASLRASLGQRTPVVPAAEPVAAPVELATAEVRAADAPAEFELRRELLEGFHQLERDDRQAAIGRLAELARWGDAEALELVVASLADESGGVRARALKELARLDEANLPAYLRESLADPSHKVRAVVASKLDELPAPEAGPLLVGLLRDADSEVVIEAIQSLDELEYGEARPVLVETLQAKDLDVATRAAQALVALGDPSAAGGTIARILGELAKDDVEGRIKHVKRLRRLRAVDALERILASDASLAVREEAREALVRIED